MDTTQLKAAVDTVEQDHQLVLENLRALKDTVYCLKEPAKTSSGEVVARLDEFSELGRPLVTGPSRKSFLVRPLAGDVPAPARDWATAAAVTAAVLAGAHVVRVHAVAEMLQVARVADEIRRYYRVDS